MTDEELSPVVRLVAHLSDAAFALVDSCAGVKRRALDAGLSMPMAEAMAGHTWNLIAPQLLGPPSKSHETAPGAPESARDA